MAPDRPNSGRHRKPTPPVTSVLPQKPVMIAAGVAGSALIVSSAVASGAIHIPWTGSGPHPVVLSQEAALRQGAAGAARGSGPRPAEGKHARSAQPRTADASATSAAALAAAKRAALRREAQRPVHRPVHRPAHRPRHAAPPPPPVYLNPLRDITGLIPERIDMGVDFGGTGPIFALGDAVITNADGNNAGWPGGGWITYQLTDGPAAGLMVYVAEDVSPTVTVGEKVTSATVIANMYNGGAGIETGWAMPNGASAESQLAEAGGISGGGPFPTSIGLNFEEILEATGVPGANNLGQATSGIVPSNYSADWAAALR
jgi:hypothetical protein